MESNDSFCVERCDGVSSWPYHIAVWVPAHWKALSALPWHFLAVHNYSCNIYAFIFSFYSRVVSDSHKSHNITWMFTLHINVVWDGTSKDQSLENMLISYATARFHPNLLTSPPNHRNCEIRTARHHFEILRQQCQRLSLRRRKSQARYPAPWGIAGWPTLRRLRPQQDPAAPPA